MEEPTQTLTDDNFDVLGLAGRSRPEICARGSPAGRLDRSRFQIDGLKPGVKSALDIENKVRTILYMYLDELVRHVRLKRGEVRDVGDVKISEQTVE